MRSPLALGVVGLGPEGEPERLPAAVEDDQARALTGAEAQRGTRAEGHEKAFGPMATRYRATAPER